MNMHEDLFMKKEKPNTTVFSLICGTIPKKPNTDRSKVADIDFQNDKGIYNELAGEISAETAADVVYPTEISTSVILPGENTAYIPAV